MRPYVCKECSFVSVGDGSGDDKGVSYDSPPIHMKHNMRCSALPVIYGYQLLFLDSNLQLRIDYLK